MKINQILVGLTIILLIVNAPTLLGSHQTNVFANGEPNNNSAAADSSQGQYLGQTGFGSKNPQGIPSAEHVIPYHSKDNAALSNEKQNLGSNRATQVSNGPLVAVSSSQIVSSGLGFDGLDMVESGGWYPPDVQVAVGQNHIVEMVNSEVEVFDKTGSSLQLTSMASFFNTGSDFISDPKIAYDSQSSRWFATLSDITKTSVLVAVSTSDDALSSWKLFSFSFGDNSNYCPDQPILGLNDDKVVLSTNEFTNKCGINGGSSFYVGAQYVVIDKSALTATITPSPIPTKTFGPDSSLFSVHPAQSLDSSSATGHPLYMVSVGSGSTSTLKFFTITGNPSALTTVTTTNIPISSVGIPPDAIQKGTSSLVATGDSRVQDAKWRNNNLWVALNDQCTPSGDSTTRACLHFVELSTTPITTKTQDFLFGINGNYLFYPALEIDASNNLDVIYGFSSSNDYPSLYATGQSSGATSFQQPTLLKTGQTYDNSGRFGDYFGAGVDPSNTNKVWVAGEYHKSSISNPTKYWATWISAITQSALDSTTTSITPSSQSLYAGGQTSLTATVADITAPSNTPTGTVAWSDGGAGGSFGSSLCSTVSNALSCTETYTTPSTGSSVTITGTYSGDSTHAMSTGTDLISFIKDGTTSIISGPTLVAKKSLTLYTIHVTDTTTPTGTVKWTVSGGGSFSNSGTCTLSQVIPSDGSCSITYKAPPTKRVVTITATYDGDSTHNTSNTSLSVSVG